MMSDVGDDGGRRAVTSRFGSNHSRPMLAAGALLFVATAGFVWLIFRNVTVASLDLSFSWIAFAVLMGAAIWLWKRTKAAQDDNLDAGFLLGDGAREKGVVARALKWAVIKKERDGLVGLAILCGISTSIASFYTTFMGSLTFFGYKPFQLLFAFLLALGVQGLLYIASWLVAEEAATHARVGARASRDQSWLANRFVLKHGSKVAILVVCMFASIFFSFASHFQNVYGEERLALANVQNARSDTTKVLVDTEKAIIDERNAVSSQLKSSSEWATFNSGLERLLQVAERQPDLVRKVLNERRATVEGDLARIRAEREGKATRLAEINGRIKAIGSIDNAAPAAPQTDDSAALAQLNQQAAAARTRRQLFEAAAEVEVTTGNDPERIPAECQAIAKAQVANRVSLPVQAKKGKKGAATPTPTATPTAGSARTEAKSGPVHRCLLENAKEAEINQRRLEAEIARINKVREGQLTAAASRSEDIGKLEATRDRLIGEIATLKSHEDDALQTFKGIEGSNQQAMSNFANGDLVKTVRGDRDEFLRAGSRAVFDRLLGSCATLQDIVQRNKDVGGNQVSTAQCDTSGLLAPIDRLTTLNTALAQYRTNCVVNQEFNTLGEPAKYVSKGSECLALAKVPERTIEESNVIDRVAQLNHPATSSFERAVASLRRGDILAWLSLALAIAVDVLVLLSAMLGARANSSVLLRHGKIDSTEELKDVLAEDADIQIYGDEPKNIVRAKLCLAAVTHRRLEQNEPVVAVVDLHRIPLRQRSNLRNFLNSVGFADLARALPNVDHQFWIDHDLILQLNRRVGDFERLRQLEHGPRPLQDDEDWSSVGEAPPLRTVDETSDTGREPPKQQSRPGDIGDHPNPSPEPKRSAQTAPGPKKRFTRGGFDRS
jgi:hypothetical protein